DNVRDGDAVNQLLAEESAALTVAAMESIRERDLLDVGFLECLPLDLEAFPKGNLLRPIYDQVRRALVDRPLVPTADGRHLPAARRVDCRALRLAVRTTRGACRPPQTAGRERRRRRTRSRLCGRHPAGLAAAKRRGRLPDRGATDRVRRTCTQVPSAAWPHRA